MAEKTGGRYRLPPLTPNEIEILLGSLKTKRTLLNEIANDIKDLSHISRMQFRRDAAAIDELIRRIHLYSHHEAHAAAADAEAAEAAEVAAEAAAGAAVARVSAD